MGLRRVLGHRRRPAAQRGVGPHGPQVLLQIADRGQVATNDRAVVLAHAGRRTSPGPCPRSRGCSSSGVSSFVTAGSGRSCRLGPGPGEDPGVRLPGILLGDDDLILALGEAVAGVGPLAHDALVGQEAQVQGRHLQVVLHGQRRADHLIEGRRGRHAVLLHAAVRGRQVVRESAVRAAGEAGVGQAGQEDHVRLVRLERTGGVRQRLGHQGPVHGSPERLAVAFRGWRR